MIYSEREVDGRSLVLRDLTAADIEPLIAYWHEADPAYLEFLGVDAETLGTREDTRRRFEALIPTGNPEQDRVAFVSALDGEVVLYVNFHFVAPDENYLHGHIIRPELRSRGLGSSSFGNVMRIAFDQFPRMERLLFVTQPHNTKVNGMLAKVGLTFERRYLDDPDGLARPGWFNIFTFTREMATMAVSAPSAGTA